MWTVDSKCLFELPRLIVTLVRLGCSRHNGRENAKIELNRMRSHQIQTSGTCEHFLWSFISFTLY